MNNDDDDLVRVDTVLVELGNVLSNAQKRVIHHGTILIVHAHANGHFHIATTFHLDQQVVAIVMSAVLKVVVILVILSVYFFLSRMLFFQRFDLLRRQFRKLLVGENRRDGSRLKLKVIFPVDNLQSLGQRAFGLFQDTLEWLEKHHVVVVGQLDFPEDLLLDLFLD